MTPKAEAMLVFIIILGLATGWWVFYVRPLDLHQAQTDECVRLKRAHPANRSAWEKCYEKHSRD